MTEYPPSFRKYETTIQHWEAPEYFEESVKQVKIIYQAFSGPWRSLYIVENNSSYVPRSKPSNGYTFWTYLDTQIEEKQSVDKNLSELEKQEIIQFDYDWYRKNVGFQVTVKGYDQTEARKFITSMIDN